MKSIFILLFFFCIPFVYASNFSSPNFVSSHGQFGVVASNFSSENFEGSVHSSDQLVFNGSSDHYRTCHGYSCLFFTVVIPPDAGTGLGGGSVSDLCPDGFSVARHDGRLWCISKQSVQNFWDREFELVLGTLLLFVLLFCYVFLRVWRMRLESFK